MMSAVKQHLQERVDDEMIQEHYKMPDNTNNKRRFMIWHLTATVIAVGGMIVELLTSIAFIGLIGVVIAMTILFSAKRRCGAGSFDERTLEIHRMAASTAFRLTAVGLLIIWLLNRYLHPVISAMSGEEVSDGVGLLICLMLCCYLGFYVYYIGGMSE
ncbi:MAG: hypothetical protein EF813_00695 [Methanosarcinales archaeon]|nr:MAG: hypothetical protein EF813_00695 [Methanosarcinales archaeon]